MREEWEYKKLGEVASVTDYVANGSFATLRENVHYLDTKGYAILIRYADYSNGFDPNKYVYIDEHAYNFLSKSKLYGGEIIMSNVGSIGKLFICPKLPMPMSLAPNSIVINTPNNRFYHYYFKSNSFQGLLKTISSKTALPKFNKTQFKGLVTPVPPLSEQQHIVSELDLLSSIIEKKKAQLKEYDDLAQSIFYDMFGDPVTNEKGWEVVQLGSKCEVSSFKRVLIEDVVDEGIPFIRGTELMSLSKGDKTPFTLFITPEHYEKVKKISGVPKIGDLLIPSINANGSVWVLDTEEPRYFKDGRVLWVHVDNNSYTSQALRYIMHYLIMNDYSSVASGATFAELKLFVLRELNTILPPRSFQQSFDEKIKAIEKQKELIKQSITEAETLFNNRMDYYFD